MNEALTKFYRVTMYINDTLRAFNVEARDVADAQEVAIDRLEDQGLIHGSILSIKRVI